MILTRIISIFIGFVLIMFVLGLAVGQYEGDEIKYTGLNFSSTDSDITIGAEKVVDGGLYLVFGVANLLGDYAIEQDLDLREIMEYLSKLFWGIVGLVVLINLIKLGVYFYVIIQEIKISRLEKKRLQELGKR